MPRIQTQLKRRKFKRLLTISDLHCGHQTGLTPPGYYVPIKGQKQEKYAAVRKELWSFFHEKIEIRRPYDLLVINGDALEGKGIRSGGTELITTDRNAQCEIARMIIEYINAPQIRMVYGTPSHTGTEEDWEDIIADKVGAHIGSHEWYSINGTMFDFKHKIGSSTIPHGRLTPLAREIMWNRLWHSRGMQPKADVLVRSHDHYFEQCDHDECLGFITPALQGFGNKFGSRECSGTVDLGFLVFDCYEDGGLIWHKEIIKGKTMVAQAEVF